VPELDVARLSFDERADTRAMFRADDLVTLPMASDAVLGCAVTGLSPLSCRLLRNLGCGGRGEQELDGAGASAPRPMRLASPHVSP
jgi:hypothetical protein